MTSTLETICTGLNTKALQAFEQFCAEHTEIRAAAEQLRDDNFARFMENNAARFLAEFEQAGR